MACEWLVSAREKVAQAVFEYLDRTEIPSNAVIVFDIDHTLLDQHGAIIPPIVYLYHAIKSKGITPIIVTAREGRSEVVRWTQDQLRDLGIDGYTYMYFLGVGKTDPWHYKKIARKNVHERGYIVIATIGDEQWDHGEFGGVGFMVPKCFCNATKINMQYFA